VKRDERTFGFRSFWVSTCQLLTVPPLSTQAETVAMSAADSGPCGGMVPSDTRAPMRFANFSTDESATNDTRPRGVAPLWQPTQLLSIISRTRGNSGSTGAAASWDGSPASASAFPPSALPPSATVRSSAVETAPESDAVELMHAAAAAAEAHVTRSR